MRRYVKLASHVAQVVRNAAIWLLVLPASSAGAQDMPYPPAASSGYSNSQIEDVPRPDALRSESQAFALADFEAIALRNNPTLAAASARVMAARGRQVQARLYPNPVIGYHATEVGNLGSAGQQGAIVSQRFLTGGKRLLDQAIAGREMSRQQYLFGAQELRVLSDVRMRFYDMLAAQRRTALSRDLVKIGDDLATAIERLHQGGQVGENDVLQAEIEAEQAHILGDNAANELEEAWRRLAAIVGLPTMQLPELVGDLQADIPTYNWDDCYALAVAQSPELAAAAARIEGAELAVARARRENIPDVDVAVSVRHHNVTTSDIANIQLGIPLPIFNRNQGNTMRAQADLVAATSDARRIELELQDRLATAYRRYMNARQQADRYSVRILPRARKSLDLVDKAYREGQADYLALITSQRTYVRVALAYLDALQELRLATSLIEGRLLSESLSAQP